MSKNLIKKLKRKVFYFLLLIIQVISFIPLYAQSSIDLEIELNQKKLNRIRIKIDSLKQSIEETKRKKKSVLEQLDLIHREMSFLNQVKVLLQKDIGLLSKRIDQTSGELEETKKMLEKLRDEAIQRILYNYKYGKLKNVELLLSSNSFTQSLARYKYLKYFWQQEARLIQSIKHKIEEKEELETIIKADLENRKNTLREKDADQKKYLNKKKEKEILIRQLKWTEENLKKELSTLEMSRKMIRQSIQDWEEQKRKQYAKIPINDNRSFKLSKGKLSWPIKGRVIRKYGKVHDKNLNTWINNTGIDIKAKAGTKIRTIFSGTISMITYLPGYGNTVIIDHYNGYYSVYAHLDDIFVEREESVEKNQIIGIVGDSGSLEGAKLHFEIYEDERTENPLLWLE